MNGRIKSALSLKVRGLPASARDHPGRAIKRRPICKCAGRAAAGARAIAGFCLRSLGAGRRERRRRRSPDSCSLPPSPVQGRPIAPLLRCRRDDGAAEEHVSGRLASRTLQPPSTSRFPASAGFTTGRQPAGARQAASEGWSDGASAGNAQRHVVRGPLGGPECAVGQAQARPRPRHGPIRHLLRPPVPRPPPPTSKLPVTRRSSPRRARCPPDLSRGCPAQQIWLWRPARPAGTTAGSRRRRDYHASEAGGAQRTTSPEPPAAHTRGCSVWTTSASGPDRRRGVAGCGQRARRHHVLSFCEERPDKASGWAMMSPRAGGASAACAQYVHRCSVAPRSRARSAMYVRSGRGDD